jgi:anthranilate phosphoribosyltransferase
VIAETLHKIGAGADLSREEAEAVMEELLEGRLAHQEIVGLLTALRAKGETVEELVGFARVMRRHVRPVRFGSDGARALVDEWPLVDTAGTGGDNAGTFNVSTAAAFVIAGAGVRVAKHGNRSISSRSGSADVLEALGVNLQAASERAGEMIEQIGIGFLFAPAMHTAMKHAMAARREVGGRTVFNLLGPLTNPAGASVQAFVVHGVDGLDEISLSDETEVADVRPHSVQRYRIAPEDFGIARAARQAMLGGDAAANAVIIRRILEGESGPRRDIVRINAAAALVATGTAADFREGAQRAAEAIDSGAALAKLEALIAFSSR